ncbi:MAG TPA: hypothetical protein DGM69_08060 [Chloroflexi bacterium]|nr:hypothetical protein [Chloroflexota bacterium]
MAEDNKKVLVADEIAYEGIKRLEEHCHVDVQTSIVASELLKIINDYSGLIVRSRTVVTEDVLKAGTDLEVIGRCGVGVDNIDLVSCKKRGVKVVNCPTSLTIAVAELTFGLLLGLARKVTFCDREMKSGNWPKKQYVGNELNGKILGLIALGRIGAEVARIANAFGMSVIAYDPYVDNHKINNNNIMMVDLDVVFSDSDYLSVHAPLNEETKHLISHESFDKMKDGVKIVCAARGGIINEDALLNALELGKVSGAALDVFEIEPPVNDKLINNANVIATPHIGAQTKDAQIRAGVDIAEEVVAVLTDKKIRWRVV